MLANRVRMGRIGYKNDKEFIDVYGFGRLVLPPDGALNEMWTENTLSLDTELPLIYFSTLEYHVVNISNVRLAANIQFCHRNIYERIDGDWNFFDSWEPLVSSKNIDVDNNNKSYIDDNEYVFEALPNYTQTGTRYKTIEEVPKGKLGYYLSIVSNLIADAEVEGVITVREGSSVGDIIYRDGFRLLTENACYLTTAMVGYFNKADDGIELTAMRKLREKYKYKHSITLAEYERVSPHIIHGIEQSGDRDYWYSEIKKIVDSIVIWVANNEWERAEVAYLSLYYKLKCLFYREVRE